MDAPASSPALTPPPGNARFPLVDGLRAVAALSVVAYHVGTATSLAAEPTVLGHIVNRLDVGVALFFVISGFLLYRPFVTARTLGSPRPSVRAYARRRLLRIVPGYWVALTVLLVWPGLPDVSWTNWPLYYGFAQIYSAPHIFSGLSVAWSLCTEMSFYLVLPLYAACLTRVARRRPAAIELTVLGALAVASIAANHLFVQDGRYNLSKTLLGTFDWFSIGMALALITATPDAGSRRAVAWLARHGWVTWASGVCLFGFLATNRAGGAEHVLYGLIAGAFVLPAVGAHEHVPRRLRSLLGNPIAAWLGLVSYGIYLWHDPIASRIARTLDAGTTAGRAAELVPIAAAAIALGAASYYVVELPFLRRKEGTRRPR